MPGFRPSRPASPAGPPPARRRAAFAAGLAAAVVLAVPLLQGCNAQADGPAGAGGPPPAAPVSVSPAVQRPIADSEEFSGRLEATEYVEIRPRVGGTIDKVHFVDGATAKKGELLFTIDPRPFQAELARAQSQLESTKARAELAQSELARAEKLLGSRAISKQEVDQLSSGSRTSRSDIQGAEAALRVARLNLEYTQVRAPISGRLSRANITAGNLVDDQTVMTSIAGVSKVYAYFEGSEQTYLKLQSAKAGGKPPSVRMALADEQGFPHEGQLDFIDNRLNPQTGAIRLRASFDNSAGRFTPGLAAKLLMQSPTAKDALLVPERAIGTDQSKKVVYVVGGDGHPQAREVKLGALLEGMRVVQGNLKPGDNVVVEGLQRIQPGSTVAPQVLKTDDKGLPIFPPPASGPPAGKG